MKKVIIKIGILLLIVIIGICSYFNFIKPVKIEVTDVSCQNWDATYESVKAFEKNYKTKSYDTNKTVVHNFDGKLPSDNPKDYMTVYINVKADNRCWFQPYVIDGYISDIGKYKEMALFSATMSDAEVVRAFRNDYREGQIVLDIYVGKHTDDEIKEFVRSITIAASGEGEIIGKQKTTLKLTDLDKITIER